MKNVQSLVRNRIEADSYLSPHQDVIRDRILRIAKRQEQIGSDLVEFASGHLYFGLHRLADKWVLREWAPNAIAIYIKGSFNNWKREERFTFKSIGNGSWEMELESSVLQHQDLFRLEIHWPGGFGERIPAWIRRVIYNPETNSFDAQVWCPEEEYQWKHERPVLEEQPLLVYETHIGMAQEEEKVGSYPEFQHEILPRIKDAGYNCIQLMAIAEHPYYASFGYQVANFFAPSSRFGTPEELKALVDEAHRMGIVVLMDIIHSHAVKNEVEGISKFDGTPYQYFHDGGRGEHPAWDSRCFDYAKPEVLHFLLSNCRYWMDEYRFDGFRFDGVTSMLYKHHGLGTAFTSYDDYFNDTVDEDALTYLTLANMLIHSVHPEAVTIAEDVSGMPGLAVPLEKGGSGFDYRYAMGIPDYWIKLTKDTPDEHWSMGGLWHELVNRRNDEKTISYAESHDQALVGDQTLIFRLLERRIYDGMNVSNSDPDVFRGISLHKMIRLITLATAGHGYLNFMGNEFGHPEWIDFPREGNQWSYKYARRQWHLADDPNLKYFELNQFDKALMGLASEHYVPDGSPDYLYHLDESAKIIAFSRAGLYFVFNFHPVTSFTDYRIPAPEGEFRIILDTDSTSFGGHGRQDHTMCHQTDSDHFLHLYIPSRTAMVLERIEKEK